MGSPSSLKNRMNFQKQFFQDSLSIITSPHLSGNLICMGLGKYGIRMGKTCTKTSTLSEGIVVY